MIGRLAGLEEAGTVGPSPPAPAANRPGLLSILFLSAWCGLVAGLLEVGTIVLRKQMFDPNHLYGMSRHFVWLIPLANVCVFLAMGLLGWVVVLAWPRRGRWLFVARLVRDGVAADGPGRFPPDLQPGLVRRGAGGGGLARPAARAACRRVSGGSSGSVSRRPWARWRSWGHRPGSATGSSNRARMRGPCRRRGRPMSS